MSTVTLTVSTGGASKVAPGQTISFNIGGASISAGSVINGIILKPTLARSPTGPTASEIILNVTDTRNDASTTSTINKVSSTTPAPYPSFNNPIFGSDNELYGLSTWNANSFTSSGFTVHLRHVGSTGLFYWEATGTEAIIHFSDPEGGNIKLTTGNIKLTAGKITL